MIKDIVSLLYWTDDQGDRLRLETYGKTKLAQALERLNPSRESVDELRLKASDLLRNQTGPVTLEPETLVEMTTEN